MNQNNEWDQINPTCKQKKQKLPYTIENGTQVLFTEKYREISRIWT